jgi:calcium/calmodulin-dependent protein kinase I
LEKHDLTDSLVQLRRFNAKGAWKRAVNALGFCATAPFWKTDAISFAQQLVAWDNSTMTLAVSDASSVGTTNTTTALPVVSSSGNGLLGKLPKIKFTDVYETKRHVRKGKYASVWECVHKPSGTVHAVKIIQRAGLEPKDDEAILNEVAVMQSLSGNKYVVQLLDFYEEESCFYLVMEYCAGGDVFDRVVHFKRYTENDARSLALILLKAIRSIHKAGIAHRDIKPQNLLLLSPDDNALIRVADFGFARRVHMPESLTHRVGTPTYVAPEILKNIPHDHRVDLWSAGVVIFVLLVGYPPFLDENQTTLFQKIRNGEFEFIEEDWRHISCESRSLVEGLLRVDPNDRWTIEDCLSSPWIRQDPAQLSCVDLSEALRVLREQKSRLRCLARAFMGFGDLIQPVDVPTQTQSTASEVV